MATLAHTAPRIQGPGIACSPGGAQSSSAAGCNFLKSLAASPAAATAYLACEQGLAQGLLTGRQRELLALAVAEINGSSYCLSAHYAAGRRTGLTNEEMKYARRATAKDPQTDALLRFVQEVTLQRGEVSDADYASLKTAGFNDGQIAEIVANIALNIFTNYYNRVARTLVDFPVLKPGHDAPAPC